MTARYGISISSSFKLGMQRSLWMKARRAHHLKLPCLRILTAKGGLCPSSPTSACWAVQPCS